MAVDMISLMRLIQFTDSAFPVGTFSFSNGLETAIHEKIVYDADTLEQYTQSISLQAAYSDAIAALLAYRAACSNDYETVVEADHRLIRFKMNDEVRLMQTRMGKKMAELSVQILNDATVQKWLDDINAGKTPGTYPIAQALVFAKAGLSEKQLFCSHQYGIINMVLGAALRSVRVSHYDTQKILFNLSDQIEKLYNEVCTMEFDDMYSFVPQIDILASLHEKGKMRMFMN